MNGREAVRAIREGGRLPEPPPSAFGMIKSSLWLAVVAVIGAGVVFAAVTFVPLVPQLSISALMPAKEMPSFAKVGSVTATSAAKPAAVAERTDFGGLSKKEWEACQNAAGQSDFKTMHGWMASGEPAMPVIASSVSLACLARTQPVHFCNPDGAYAFLVIALEEGKAYAKATAYLDNPPKSGDPSVASLPRSLVAQYYDDLRRLMEPAHQRVKSTIKSLVKKGLLQADIARHATLGHLPVDAAALLDGLPAGPNACL